MTGGEGPKGVGKTRVKSAVSAGNLARVSRDWRAKGAYFIPIVGRAFISLAGETGACNSKMVIVA